MQKANAILLSTALMFMLSGCAVSSLSVLTDYDEDADFSQYKTYYWSDSFQHDNAEDEPLFYNSLIQKRLKSAIAKEMEGRGYVLDATNPDLLIDSRVIVEQHNDQRTYGYSPYMWYYPGTYQTSSQRKEGGVIVELIDTRRAQLVWQGFAPDVLRQEEKDKQQEIRDAVTMIFSKFEHRAGGG